MCVCVCMHLGMFVWAYVYACVRICIYMGVYICACARFCVCVYTTQDYTLVVFSPTFISIVFLLKAGLVWRK